MKMERDTSSSVGLHVFGSKNILSKPINAQANLDNTWHQFLTETCRLPISPDANVMVCSTSYCQTRERGWAASLPDKIRDFVSKYTIKKDKYSVRLAFGTASMAVDATVSADSQNTSVIHPPNTRQNKKTKRFPMGNRDIPSSNGHSSKNPPPSLNPLVISQSTKGPVINSVVGNHLIQNRQRSSHDRMQYAEDDMEQEVGDAEDANVFDYQHDFEIESSLEDVDEDEDDDAMSMCTAASMEQVELRNAGVEITALKPLVEDRLQRFPNTFLLRVQDEIRKLRRNKLWYRNVQRSPRACYLLQEIFK